MIVKIMFCFILTTSSNTILSLQQPVLDLARNNFTKVATDELLCEKLIKKLEKKKEKNAVGLAYLGAFQTIWAKHVLNPISKLKTFNKGKKNIENAVNLEPHNIEIRLIRLTIQKNAPSFLGYNNNIGQDSEFIKLKKDEINSPHLQRMFLDLNFNKKD